ncbi:hypothetical protein [Foetidibacter luteolus]|uniref:hypothetical protein n=1 Tax=Foetidibacter luteolus TaxID=2608880 RepID=UPI00129BC50B|nr:hypothetical protein [Foetidibacter luteolus]
MYKVILFEDANALELQEKINRWLAANKDATIHQTNIGCAPLAKAGNTYVFYILYTSAENREEELKELAKEAVAGEVLEPKEINPAIMDAGSIYNQ